MSKYANKVKENSQSKVKEIIEVNPSLFDSEWVKCPECYEELKSKNLEHHLGKVHKLKTVKKGQGKMNILLLLGLIVVIIVLLSIGIYFFTANDSNDDDGNEIETPTEGWLDNYSPNEKLGSSEDDWWTAYPNQNPNWGEMPNHPTWITQKLKQGPVLILDHSEGCMPCIQQQEDVDIIMDNYGNDIQLMDLLSGSDPEATEAFNIYDANGSPNYIPLTIIVTLVEDSSGNVRIGWHSAEGATGGEWLTNYVMDAIYYHHNNVDDWS